MNKNTINLRVLVLDDNIKSAFGTIYRNLSPFIKSTFELSKQPDLGSGLIKIPLDLVSGEAITITLASNLPSEVDVRTIDQKIKQGGFPQKFDLILMDDNWPTHGFGGQEILLETVYKYLSGEVDELPLICLFTQHWQAERLRQFFGKIHEKELSWSKLIPCNKSDGNQLLHVLFRALTTKKMAQALSIAKAEVAEGKTALSVMGDLPETLPGFIGDTLVMRTLYKLILKVAKTDTTVLITGESGTGKEVVAKAIHYNSLRKDRKFVGINCGALPAEIIESELFGHEKGAFTGAIANKEGKFESAKGGTLFLDEIGELPLPLQVKLLRVLEERQFYPVGGKTILDADFRLIAATNRNLECEVEEDRFREDLYYRLNVFDISCPPLRNRKSDIPKLAEHFLKGNSSKKLNEEKKLADDVIERLKEYSWPGNVRQLKNCIERAVLISDGPEITLENLPPKIRESENQAKISRNVPNQTEDNFIELGDQIFKMCLKKKVIEDEADNKEYILLNIMLHPLGRKPSDEELAAIDYEGGTQKLTQAISRLRRKMKDKKIGYTIKVKDGSPRIVPATDFD